jgi:hypothetical protein
MAIDPQFKPTTAQVAVFVKNRTVVNNVYLGDFTTETAVTAAEVDSLIEQAGGLVLSACRWDPTLGTIPPDNYEAVKTLIAMLTAILIELTKYSEQVARGVSPYTYLKEVFDGMLSQKQAELGIMPPSDGGGGGLNLWDLVSNQYGRAIFVFPDPDTVNWETAY